MKNLIVIGHPDPESFCYDGIMKTIRKTLEEAGEEVTLIDLYADGFSAARWDANKKLVENYKRLIDETDRIYFISPVWWFRCTPLIEGFFDQVFTPGFAYEFVDITEKYGIPKPLLSDKKVRTFLTHGAPALPVYTLYVNSVKLRLVMGVYSFVFGWFATKTRQLWSVPFVSDKKRKKYLRKVAKDIRKDLKAGSAKWEI